MNKYPKKVAYIIISTSDLTNEMINRSTSISVETASKSLDGTLTMLSMTEPIPDVFVGYELLTFDEAKQILKTSEWSEV